MAKDINYIVRSDGRVIIKTRNAGESGEDSLTKVGATPNSIGIGDHTWKGRKLEDKTWNGANPTILNARKVLCKIDPTLTPAQLEEVRNIDTGSYKFDRIARIVSYGCELSYQGFDNSQFQKGLASIDPNLPKHLGDSVIDWRTKRPIKGLVVHEYSKKYPSFVADTMQGFLHECLLHRLNPDGIRLDTVDDLCFIKKSNKRFFDVANDDHRVLVEQALLQNAYFDAPKDSRYKAHYPLDNGTIYLSFQIRLKYHSNFSKGRSLEEYRSFIGAV